MPGEGVKKTTEAAGRWPWKSLECSFQAGTVVHAVGEAAPSDASAPYAVPAAPLPVMLLLMCQPRGNLDGVPGSRLQPWTLWSFGMSQQMEDLSLPLSL